MGPFYVIFVFDLVPTHDMMWMYIPCQI